MKKLLWFILIAFPIFIFAQEIVDVVVPDVVSDTVETTVDGFITKTWIMSSAVMAIIQALKKILGMLKFEVSGFKSQALAIAVTVLYVLANMNVWQDGQITPDDALLMIQGVLSAVGGIYGYKLLWRAKKPDIKAEEKNVCGK
jgi:uncharacterized membrane protein